MFAYGYGYGYPRNAKVGVHTFEDADAEALVDGFTGEYSAAQKRAIDELIVALKAADSWDRMDFLHVFLAAAIEDTRINWRAPGTYNLTPAGGVGNAGPAFAPFAGLTGNGTDAELDTGFNPTTASPAEFSQNDAHVAAWVLGANAAQSAAVIGTTISSGVRTTLVPRGASDTMICLTNANGNTGTAPASTDSRGYFAWSRRASDVVELYRNDQSLSTASQVSGTLQSATLRYFRGGAAFASRTLALGHAGSQFSDAQQQANYEAFDRFVQAVLAA